MMARDAASDSSNPSATNARVSASRQWRKMLPATVVSWGSFVGRADRRGHDGAASGEVALDKQLFPELDELPDQIHPALGSGLRR